MLMAGKGRSRTVYGASVVSWGTDDGAAAHAQHTAVMAEHLAATKPKERDEWDLEYDRGRTPKRKLPQDDTGPSKKANRFQSLHEKKKMKQHHDGTFPLTV